MKALGLDIQTPGERQNEQVQRGLEYAMCEIYPTGKPSSISLRVNLVREQDGVTPFVMYRGMEHGFPYALEVPVEWEGNNPKTRILDENRKGYDNADALLWGAMADFTDVQFGVTVRFDRETKRNRFYLTIQIVYRGAVRIIDDKSVFIPGKPHFNHPLSNYAATWERMGRALATAGHIAHETAVVFGGELEPRVAPEWEHAQLPAKEGWLEGTVMYFNLITGTGMVEGVDGALYFVHFNNIRVECDGRLARPELVPVLEPGQGVYFQPEGNQAKPCIPYRAAG